MTKIKIIQILIIAMCLLGLAVSIYLYKLDLKVEKLDQQTPQDFKIAPCDINAFISCSTVAKSEYSEIADVKVALMGIAGYITLLILFIVFLIYRKLKLLYLFAAIALFGAIFSTYLTGLELSVINAICPWCVVSNVLMLLILGLGIYLYYRFRKMETRYR